AEESGEEDRQESCEEGCTEEERAEEGRGSQARCACAGAGSRPGTRAGPRPELGDAELSRSGDAVLRPPLVIRWRRPRRSPRLTDRFRPCRINCKKAAAPRASRPFRFACVAVQSARDGDSLTGAFAPSTCIRPR